jgi:hypothetical protein
MGMFSRLFGGAARDDRSFVRTWAEKRKQELRHSNLSVDSLFAVMIYALCFFGEKDKKQSTPPELLSKLGLDVSEKYSGDAALFELGCYMYFRLDLWLFKNKPDRRENITIIFADNFIRLFTQALNSREIPSLFDQRITEYAKLARTGADFEQYHYHLSQLIFRTRDNQLPAPYDFENESMMITGVFEDMGVKHALIDFEADMLPILVENLKKYCDLTE